MKKSLLLLVATALVVSCTNDSVRNDVEENSLEIGFDANTYKTTRAEITDNAALATAGGFIVWGYKAKSQETMNWATDAYTVFDGVKVSAKSNTTGTYISGNETNWTYATKKYWDKNAKYCFYAAAPYKANTYSISEDANNAKMIIINGATSGLASASDDFLVARGGVKDRAGSDQSNVDFTFNHTMTKVDFLLKKGDNVDGEVKVQSITMTGWNSGTGKFTQNSNNTPSNLDKSEWAIATSGAGSVSILTGTTAALTTTADKSTTQDYIMVPQSINANTLTFTINFTVDGEPFNNHVGTVPAAQTWGTDSHFTYTITIAPATIEFDVKSIAGFNNVTAGALTVE